MVKRFSAWGEREFGLRPRVLATLAAGGLFVILIPLLLYLAGPALDRRLGVPAKAPGRLATLLGGVMLPAGWAFALWSIYAQLAHGRGTPLPMMATQRLLTGGPFAYCRNPMSLGTIVMYLGLGLLIGSPSAIGIVLLLAVFLLAYIKRVEERELEIRFGDAYRAYKRSTPFIIPALRRGSP